MVGECWWWNVRLYESGSSRLRTYVLICDIVMETHYLFHVYHDMTAGGMERLYILTHQNVFMLLFTCGGRVV